MNSLIQAPCKIRVMWFCAKPGCLENEFKEIDCHTGDHLPTFWAPSGWTHVNHPKHGDIVLCPAHAIWMGESG